MKQYLFAFLFLGVASGALAQTPSPDNLAAAAADSLAPPDSVATPPPAAAAPLTPPPPPSQPVQTQTAPQTTEPPSDVRSTETYAKSNKPSRWYYGATVGFNFWGDVRRFSIQPMLAFKLTPRLSVGGELGYEHLKDTSGSVDREYDNYGASVFSRFRLTQRFYGHAEYQAISYDFPGEREVVPFLLVGGGIVQSASQRVSLYAEVLVDVLQDENSPYNDWEPQVSVGVGVGF